MATVPDDRRSAYGILGCFLAAVAILGLVGWVSWRILQEAGFIVP
jgi:hypothetical protein